jgi:cysteine synthase B
MIRRAEERGEIKPGDTLIEATSGNTGIALAMAAAIRGYRMVLIMPEDLSIERAQTMKAFGAELMLTPRSGGMEYARDLADKMVKQGKGRVLDQFANPDNPRIHYETTGPELWEQTGGRITHFVSAMGTTGTITGVSRFLKEKNSAVRIIGAQPAEGSRIPGIRKWPQEYLPRSTTRRRWTSWCPGQPAGRRGHGATAGARGGHLRRHVSSGGAGWVAQQIAARVHNATIVFVVCDRGDRYLSTGVFPPDAQVLRKSSHGAPMNDWNFCPRCATPLAMIAMQEDGGEKERLRCPACGFTHWNNPTAGAGGDHRIRRSGAAGAQRGVAEQDVCPDHRLHGGRRDTGRGHRA